MHAEKVARRRCSPHSVAPTICTRSSGKAVLQKRAVRWRNCSRQQCIQVAEGPRDALSQLKSCQLLLYCTKSRIWKCLQCANDLERDSRSAVMALFDTSRVGWYTVSMRTKHEVSSFTQRSKDMMKAKKFNNELCDRAHTEVVCHPKANTCHGLPIH